MTSRGNIRQWCVLGIVVSATVIAHGVEAGTLVAVQIRRGASIPLPRAIHLRAEWLSSLA